VALTAPGRGPYHPRVPIYEYLCEGCGQVIEVMQKVKDRPPSQCGECGSRKLAKLVSRSAFQLKGGGWYSDLYASSPQKGAKDAVREAKHGDAPKAGDAPKPGEAPKAGDAPKPGEAPKAGEAPKKFQNAPLKKSEKKDSA
jgi:putative FmdB family regulatory protein